MSPATIRRISDEAARRSLARGDVPWVPFDFTYTTLENIRHIPNVESRKPRGWDLIDSNLYEYGYAIIEADQFQVVIGQFRHSTHPIPSRILTQRPATRNRGPTHEDSILQPLRSQEAESPPDRGGAHEGQDRETLTRGNAMPTYRGIIRQVVGHPMSGLAHVIFENRPPAHISSGYGLRSLAACFGATEGSGDLNDRVRGQEIVYTVDELGVMEGFTPADQWVGPEVTEEGISEEAMADHIED